MNMEDNNAPDPRAKKQRTLAADRDDQMATLSNVLNMPGLDVATRSALQARFNFLAQQKASSLVPAPLLAAAEQARLPGTAAQPTILAQLDAQLLPAIAWAHVPSTTSVAEIVRRIQETHGFAVDLRDESYVGTDGVAVLLFHRQEQCQQVKDRAPVVGDLLPLEFRSLDEITAEHRVTMQLPHTIRPDTVTEDAVRRTLLSMDNRILAFVRHIKLNAYLVTITFNRPDIANDFRQRAVINFHGHTAHLFAGSPWRLWLRGLPATSAKVVDVARALQANNIAFKDIYIPRTATGLAKGGAVIYFNDATEYSTAYNRRVTYAGLARCGQLVTCAADDV